MGQYYKVIAKNTTGTTIYDRSVENKYTLAKLCEHGYWDNNFCRAVAKSIVGKPTRICWVGDYATKEECENLGFSYDAIWPENGKENDQTVHKTNFKLDSMFYLVNTSKKQIVNLKEYKKRHASLEWIFNPITMLTCLGNGRGGGDYYPTRESTANLVGSWAFDEIYLTNNLPEGGYEFIQPIFFE